MNSNDFYAETKWCPCCASQVRYLSSIETSYCVECGAEVRLFSDAGWARFNLELEARKAKSGRKRGRPAKHRPSAA